MRSSSLSIIKNCQMHFGRRITQPVLSPEFEVARGSPRGTHRRARGESEEGRARPATRPGVYSCAIISQCIITRTRILIDFENTIFCANDQNAALPPACYSDPVLTALCLAVRRAYVYIISTPLAFAFPFRFSRLPMRERSVTNGPCKMKNKPSIIRAIIEKCCAQKTMRFTMRRHALIFIAGTEKEER